MKPAVTLLRRYVDDDRATTAIEYGLIASLLSIVIATVVATVGTNLQVIFNQVAGLL